MLVTGRFGLKAYSLENPAKPKLLDELSAERLKLEGDPDVDFGPPDTSAPVSTFWQNEDMDVDQDASSCCSRATRGRTPARRESARATRTRGATNIAGVYFVDAHDPEALRLLAFQQLPTGHTTTCINDCRWLWTGGPAATTRSRPSRNWTFGRPIIVTDLSDPSRPRAYPMNPVDLFRRDGVTAYSHDVQVDDEGDRLGLRRRRHARLLDRRPPLGPARAPPPRGHAARADPVRRRRAPAVGHGRHTGGFEHNAERPVGRDAPRGDDRYKRGELLLVTEEDFGPAADGCKNRGQFTIASLKGSFNGEAWSSTPATRSACRWSASGPRSDRRAHGRRPARTTRSRTSARRTTSMSTAAS